MLVFLIYLIPLINSFQKTFTIKQSIYKSLYGEKEISIHKFIAKEQFKFPKGELENLKGILFSLMKQSNGYQEIFRDGQDTAKRNFIFEKNCDVLYEESKAVKFSICFVISNEEKYDLFINCSKYFVSTKHSSHAYSIIA